MSATWCHDKVTTPGGHSQDSDDAEKGLYDSTHTLPVLPSVAHVEKSTPLHIDTDLFPGSPIHEGLTPFSSVPVLSLSWPAGWKVVDDTIPDPAAKKPARPKPKISRWILFQLWFNPYRKFFIFVTLLNLSGIILAALGRFSYAEDHLGALVLGNLLCAVLFRNELFLRFLYTIAIYGLRSVSPLHLFKRPVLTSSAVGPTWRQVSRYQHAAACRGHPLWLRTLWRRV